MCAVTVSGYGTAAESLLSLLSQGKLVVWEVSAQPGVLQFRFSVSKPRLRWGGPGTGLPGRVSDMDREPAEPSLCLTPTQEAADVPVSLEWKRDFPQRGVGEGDGGKGSGFQV